MTDEPPVTSSKPADPTRTKPRFRSNHPEPTIEETIELVRTTILPLVDFPPDLPLLERVSRINELIGKAGVEPYRLRVILNKADPAAHWSQHELRIRKIPLADALKYLCDSTKLRYQIRENGIVELTTLQDPDTKPRDMEFEFCNGDPNAPQGSDPFAESSEDPFAETGPTR